MSKLLTEFVDLPDIQIAYTQYGNGHTLLLLHGNSESKSLFTQHQIKHFPMFHTIAIDSRGHGESKSNDAVYTINQFSDDVIDFCNAKGIRDAYVIGYSDGGNIALFLAKKAPDLFTRIVAISPNYLVSGTTDDGLRLIKRLYKIMSFLNRIGFNFKKSMMRFNLMLTDIGITDDELKCIQTDMKIIYAEHDMVKEAHLQRLAELIPNATLEKVNDCNHMTILNKTEAIEIMKNCLLEQN
jgi:pimeloyl-ACP methyl ester carboxylesterase